MELEEAGTGDAEKDSDSEFEEFKESYLSDPDWCAFYTRNGVFNKEACIAAIRNMYEAKKKADAEDVAKAAEATPVESTEMTAEEEPEAEDGFETAEQRGLYAKSKNFFKGNKRSRNGAKNAAKKGGLTGWKKFAYAGLLALVVGTSGSNMIQGAMPSKAPDVAQPIMTYAAEVTTPEDETKEDTVDVKTVAEDLSLKVDLNAENKGEVVSDLVTTTAYGENIEVNISYGDYDGTSEFFDYKEKHGDQNLTKPLYDMENKELTDVQRTIQMVERLAKTLDDPIQEGHFSGIGGADVVIGDKVDGITKLDDMNEVLDLALQDDEFRKALADYNKETYRDLVVNHDIKLEFRDEGSFHYSLYAYETKLEDGTTDISYKVAKKGIIAKEAFYVLQFMDADGNNVLDSNEIGGYKYNFLKVVGIIGENDTDEIAQEKMSKIRIIGFSGKCGQLIWEDVIPDTGEEKAGNESGTEKEGDEGSGTEKEGDEGSGTEKEGDEGSGTEKEGDEGSGTEKEGDEGSGTEKEGDEGSGTEKEGDEGSGTEKEGDEGSGTEKEGDEGSGTEKEGDEGGDGKTEVYVEEDNDGWTDVDQPTQEETGPIPEASGDNGYVNDNNSYGSSDVAEDDFLSGGDQGGGNTDADGGGSTNPDTEATFDGTGTSGWQGDQQSEVPGTQDVQEPSTQEEVNQVNNSEANQDSISEDTAPGEGANEAMDRLG